ncbi:mannonate dehydratase [Priestia flexa]|uniref:mannonate dehydratase n=1 Tax=Priestia flexa TaxID=86664 RepID=UPI001F4CEE3F|nr:mannonate dehydratase [Priestia flexa]
MKMSFRWYGTSDTIPLTYIKQIPSMRGIVSAIYDIPVGEVWPEARIQALKKEIEEAGLELTVIESVPVHEDIKLGLPTRDQYIASFQQTLKNLSENGITTVCYNFMPVFDWTRSSLEHRLEDDSTCLSYDNSVIELMDPVKGNLSLPGWDTSYEKEELAQLFEQYRSVGTEELWGNLSYFLEQVIPVAEQVGINLAMHPDDPPWSIFGLPRIITNEQNIERLLSLYESPNHGLCFCTGSLGALDTNDLPQMVRKFGSQGRIHFVHARNVKRTSEKSFHETAHPSEYGSVDMYEVLKALHDVSYSGPIRPDHGRMIWGETGKPGYGLFDRALGATYLTGLWEAIQKDQQSVNGGKIHDVAAVRK